MSINIPIHGSHTFDGEHSKQQPLGSIEGIGNPLRVSRFEILPMQHLYIQEYEQVRDLSLRSNCIETSNGSRFSSTLLQHLFTHLFICQQCSFYTHSHYHYSQHLFEKHQANIAGHTNGRPNPKAFDLIYTKRCPDGHFALCCVDSSASSKKNDEQRCVPPISLANDPLPTKSLKATPLKPNFASNVTESDVLRLPMRPDTTEQTVLRSKAKASKPNRIYVLMKHRRCYARQESPCLHSLTLEYNICCEHTIRQMSQTQTMNKRHRRSVIVDRTRLKDEIARCLRTVVNQIVHNEEHEYV